MNIFVLVQSECDTGCSGHGICGIGVFNIHFYCICREGFTGARCEKGRTNSPASLSNDFKITLSFNAIHYSQLLYHLDVKEIFFIKWYTVTVSTNSPKDSSICNVKICFFANKELSVKKYFFSWLSISKVHACVR